MIRQNKKKEVLKRLKLLRVKTTQSQLSKPTVTKTFHFNSLLFK
jgi:hypothetical protein